MAGTAAGGAGRRGRLAPYGLLSPGTIWLALFFLVPIVALLRMSLSAKQGRFDFEPSFTWEWANYADAFSEYGSQFLRSFGYAAVATVLAVVIGYPLAYVIAFRGGRWRNLLLGLVVVPFFTSYLIRTIAWQGILADNGWVVGTLGDLGLTGVTDALGLTVDGRILRTRTAVVGGLLYNYLPFMVLPIYVALEKIDARLVEAANDLYAKPGAAFRRVVLPLSLPGVFAGSLLVFIPASGDFVNAALLGSPQNQMIGNVVQNEFLQQLDYPVAAALSFVLMAIITLAVLVYARLLGTDELAV